MTPLAMEIYKENPFSKALEGAHFFDVTDIVDEVKSATDSLIEKIKEDPEFAHGLRLRLPFDVTWVEFIAHGVRQAWRLQDDDGDVILSWHRVSDGTHVFLPICSYVEGKLEVVEINPEAADAFEEAAAIENTIAIAFVLMLIINTPQSFIVRQRNNRQFARAHQRKFGHNAWALGAWTEIKLEIDPDLVRQIEGSAQRISGKKCFHWVKGHWKRIFGNTLRTYIGPYTRGDAQLGIAQRRYKPVPPARARTKAQRCEAVERCARIEAVLAKDCREPERTASPSDAARQGRPAARRRASKASNAPRSLSK